MHAAEWDARYAGKNLVWEAEPNRWVVEVCAGLPPGRALDLACGEGRNALWLARQGWRVTGVDFSRVALERAGDLARGFTLPRPPAPMGRGGPARLPATVRGVRPGAAGLVGAGNAETVMRPARIRG
jgi:SAM-dependent methyltransferase